MKNFIKKKWKWLFLIIPVLMAIVFSAYILDYYKAMPEAKAQLTSNAKVDFDDSSWYVYKPKNKTYSKALIIYPGGKVEPSAYVPLAEKIAEQGYMAVIVSMPLNLAIFSPDKADKVIEKYPNIKQWYIGGHSLGGVMAARYAYKNQEKITGLVLLASYPQKGYSLATSKVKVISIYGTNDGFVGKNKIDESKGLLPKDTQWLPIEGGNHSQNGWYGFQKGDKEATVTREKQQEITIEAISKFMSN